MSLLSGKWCDLTWPRKAPKFNLHLLWEISMVFKVEMLTPKSGSLFMVGWFYFDRNSLCHICLFVFFFWGGGWFVTLYANVFQYKERGFCSHLSNICTSFSMGKHLKVHCKDLRATSFNAGNVCVIAAQISRMFSKDYCKTVTEEVQYIMHWILAFESLDYLASFML